MCRTFREKAKAIPLLAGQAAIRRHPEIAVSILRHGPQFEWVRQALTGSIAGYSSIRRLSNESPVAEDPEAPLMIFQHCSREVFCQYGRLKYAVELSVLQTSDGARPGHIQRPPILPYTPHDPQRDIPPRKKISKSRSVKAAQVSTGHDPESTGVVDQKCRDRISRQAALILAKGDEFVSVKTR